MATPGKETGDISEVPNNMPLEYIMDLVESETNAPRSASISALHIEEKLKVMAMENQEALLHKDLLLQEIGELVQSVEEKNCITAASHHSVIKSLLQAHTDEMKKMIQEKVSLISERDDLLGKLKTLSQCVENVRETIPIHQSEKKRLETQRAELQVQMQHLSAMTEERGTFSQEIQRLREEIKGLTEQNISWQEHDKEQRSQISILKEQISELQSTITDIHRKQEMASKRCSLL